MNSKLRKLVKNNLLGFYILLGSLFISICIFYASGLDTLQKIFSIVGSLSVAIIIASYFYNKKQNEISVAADQITFFREKIIPEWDKVIKIIKEKEPTYWFSRIELDEYAIEYIRKKFSRNFNNQLSIFFDNSKTDWTKWIDSPILDKQIYLLNMLEEFSLRANHFNTQQHSALSSVHFIFVELVEKNAVALLFMRDIIVADNSVYSNTLSLYNSWKNKTKKSNVLKNLEKHGFMTKEMRKNILKEQRNKISEYNSNSK